MKQRYVYVLAALLTIIGLSVFFYKWQVLGFPVSENQEKPVWTIESAVHFDSGPGTIKVQLHVPTLTPGFRMLNENSVSRGYGFSLNYGSGGREAQWTIRRADGDQTIYYRISVYEDETVDQSDTIPPFPPRPVINEPLNTAVDVLVSDVRDRSADTASFTTELLRRLNDPSPDPNVELLLASVDTDTDFVGIATMLLASARIPARVVRGFPLAGRQRNAALVPWLEVHDGDQWLYFNPATGERSLPERFFVWWRGNEPLVN
ncbi:MAG: UUP1 family membrane protein, partial [Gammaproteobacteria bacterium]|nr:UUP1 family membrane protein [Gammaproteobacteria bacterium]